MRVGVVVFPGSNCDQDCLAALRECSLDAVPLWHHDASLYDCDAVILPGGFSYGDYLRCGAIAQFSPIMTTIRGYAKDGGIVIGICNGFQILTEAGLLPGVLLRNDGLRFICRPVRIRVEHTRSAITHRYGVHEVLTLPIAHADGRYWTTPRQLEELEANGQILFRYCTADGLVEDSANPNGSVGQIAGICNREGNVIGMMPHPERAVDPRLGGTDGRRLFESLAAWRASGAEKLQASSGPSAVSSSPGHAR